jgi:multiple sugar transport system substrate-binding protein
MKKMVCSFLVLVVLASTALWANGTQEQAPAADLTAPVTITVWTHEDPNRSVFEKELIKEFMQQNPNVTVDYQTYPSSKMAELLTVAFSAGEGPDVFNQSQSVIRQFVEEGQVSALEPTWIGEKNLDGFKNRYIAHSLDAVTKDGNIYGMPLEYTNLCVYLNKRLFKEAGLDPEKDYPKTWEDMMALSEKLVKRNGDIITSRGFDFRYASYYTMEMLPLVEQLGGKLVSDDGKTAVIGDEAWIKFFDFMRQWGPNGKNLGGPTYVSVSKVFDLNDGQVAMSESGLYQEARMRKANPDFYNSDDWMVIPFPQWKGIDNRVPCHVSCHYYMVNGNIPEAKQVWSWRLVNFLLSHAEGYLKACNLVQPTKTLFESDAFKAMPYSSVFKSDLEHATLTYYSGNSNAIRDKMKLAVESVMLQNETSENALKTFRRQVQDILDQQ